MKWGLVDSNLICQSVIVYDPTNLYTPPDGLTLQEVNDWIVPGDNINTSEPIPVEPNLEELRETMNQRAFQERDKHIENGIEYNGNIFYTDPGSQSVMMQAILTEINGIGEVFPTMWLTMSGNPIEITLQDAKNIMGAFNIKKKTNYNNYMSLLAQISVSEDPFSVDLSQGWA